MYVPHNEDAGDHDASIGALENEDKPAMKKPLLLRITAATLLLAITGTATWWYCFRDSADIQVATPEDGESDSLGEVIGDDIPHTLPEPNQEVFDRMTISASGDLPVESDNREGDFIPLGQVGDESENLELVIPSIDSNNYQLPAAPVTSGETYTIGDGTGSFSLGDEPLESGIPAASNNGNALDKQPATGLSGQLPLGPLENDRGFDEPEPFPSPVVRSTADLTGNTAAPNAPGRFQLEGEQIPTLSIEKHAPEEIQVNRMAEGMNGKTGGDFAPGVLVAAAISGDLGNVGQMCG